MAPVGQVLGLGIFSKTKMCKFHQAGKCAKGLQCAWAHDASELNAAPDLRRTKLCKELINNGECTNANCNFAHNKEQFRTLVHATEVLTHEALTDLSQISPVVAVKSSASDTSHAEQDSTMEIPDTVPSLLSAEAPDFIPMSFNVEAPVFVPMPSPPPGLEDYVPYSSTCGYPTFHQEESESDSSSGDDIKIDGNTPIAEILALSMLPKKRSSYRQVPAAKSASVSTAGSLGDLGAFPEDAQH
eukprot:TRINITY_DN1484_c0_g4_i1.p1 TRINITY_DN1484_c0_g4~~TRINITY_DN1484_c0_g4_i1.p1  ORF type:complete len:243 (-),score=50.21 TRINITY_DN1484_c0_g4_i1:503-1231(-)